jgi:hypothetical protein
MRTDILFRSGHGILFSNYSFVALSAQFEVR